MLQRGQGPFRVVHDRALGDLQADRGRRHLQGLDQCLDLGRQVLVHQVAGRQVDRQPQVQAGVHGLAREACRAGQHPGAEHADEAGLLGERDELHRRHQAAHRVLPAHQRLGADDAALLQVDLGLQVQAQLVGLDRMAQLGQQRQRLLAACVQLGVIDQAAALLGLGGIHGQLGAAQQQVDVLAMLGKQGDADAGAQVDGFVVDLQRLLEVLQDGQGRLAGGARVGLGQQHRELVARQPREHRMGRRAQRLQALGHALQQPVPDLVAEHVVDMLEAVQVQHQHGARRVAVVEVVLQELRETGAVGQQRQLVDIGEVVDQRVAAADALAHALQRNGQLMHLLQPRGGRHRRVVVAALQAPCGRRQVGDGVADAPRQHHAEDAEHGDAEQGQAQQRELQLPVGRQRHIQRAQQQHAQVLLAVDEGHEVGAQALAGQLNDPILRHLRVQPARQGRCGLGLQVGADAEPACATGLQQHGALQLGQGPEVVEHLAVQREGHQHPAHRRRRAHLHGDHLIDLVALHRQGGAVLVLHQPGEGAAEGRGVVARGRNQMLLLVEIGHHRGADACALVAEGIADGLDRLRLGQRRAQRAAEAIVLGQQFGGIAQLAGALVQQPAQHALAGLQFAGQRVLCVARDAGADDAEADQLHRQQQGQEEGHDAPLQAPQIEPGRRLHRRRFSRPGSARWCRRRP
mmetsp:Transcript_6689/g.27999  ORF Transcript_6689/g.27999 Transcript_6689/m.27999 type:complete len:689 (+) Transcript_6689:1417-3483(+)